jgi:catechol 2,3-dioxygenase-like lactoylglutathione lyase family enzyme
MAIRSGAPLAARWGIVLTCLLLAACPLMQAAPQNKAGIPCPPIISIAHVALRTNHFEAARQFYSHVLGFDELAEIHVESSQGRTAIFKVNDHQYIELSLGQHNPPKDLLLHVAFETTNARGLRRYLVSKNFTHLGELRRTRQGNLGFTVQDPEGHPIEFVQYVVGSIDSQAVGKDMPGTRISSHIIHAGFIVNSRSVEDGFFRNFLGFHLMWYGGMTDHRTDWVDMRVRNGSNWLEYMLNAHQPSLHTLGVLYHFSLGVPSVAEAYKTVVARGYQPKKPQIGRDGKWQLNLYDPDGTRVELMEPRPVQTPCCSPMLLAGGTGN